MLVEQVHRQGVGVTGGIGQCGLVGEDEAHARHAFQAFAAGRDQGIERNLASVDGQRAKRAHGVDDQAFTVPGDDLGDVRQRVENPGAGLTVNQRHVGDAVVGAQQAVDVGGRGRFVFGGFEGAERTAQHFADFRQAFAIGTVDQHQDLAVPWHQGADGRFDGEGAAALQGDAVVAVGAVDDGQQLFAQAGGQLVEAVIP
ncbi:hypothetical protein D3C78_1194770 [compost metagenome]